ncbi:MAG: rRNA adenine dimethyltransferase family protein [Caldilineaceae bacterium]
MNDAQALMRRYGLQPKRSLAQNFLTDEAHLARIAAAADLTANDTVIEIGPGLGVLTKHLAAQAGRVIAVELDDRLIDVLKEQFADRPHVSIVHADILNVQPVELIAATLDSQNAPSPPLPPISEQPNCAWDGEGWGGPRRDFPYKFPYKVVANLPYYITSAVLRHLLESTARPQLAVLLMQKEVAERICAQPGDLSLLAVSVQFYAAPTLVHRIPAGAFYPRPKVDSAVLRLDVYDQPAAPDVDEQLFFKVVRAGFSQKRKQIHNSLRSGLTLSKTEITEWLARAEIDPKRRAETLTLAEWGELCRTSPSAAIGL